MSQVSLDKIQALFAENRKQIYKVCNDFSQATQIKQMGQEQIFDSLVNMFHKENQADPNNNFQYNSEDYLAQVHGQKIDSHARNEAVLTVLEFAVQTDCLDQTVFQAIHFADNYLRRNNAIRPNFLRIIYCISLEIAIKMNEQMILSFEDIVQLFEQRFQLNMLTMLEKHIIQLNNFHLNPVTPLDFALHFVEVERPLWEHTSHKIPGTPKVVPEMVIDKCVPIFHYALSQYDLSRKRYSSLAVAAVCHVLQDIVMNEVFQATGNYTSIESKQSNELLAGVKLKRDAWLCVLMHKFPQIDFKEVYSIMQSLRISMQGIQDKAWDFSRIFSTQIPERMIESHFDQIYMHLQGQPYDLQKENSAYACQDTIASSLAVTQQPSLPQIGKLSLDGPQDQESRPSHGVNSSISDTLMSDGDLYAQEKLAPKNQQQFLIQKPNDVFDSGGGGIKHSLPSVDTGCLEGVSGPGPGFQQAEEVKHELLSNPEAVSKLYSNLPRKPVQQSREQDDRGLAEADFAGPTDEFGGVQKHPQDKLSQQPSTDSAQQSAQYFNRPPLSGGLNPDKMVKVRSVDHFGTSAISGDSSANPTPKSNLSNKKSKVKRRRKAGMPPQDGESEDSSDDGLSKKPQTLQRNRSPQSVGKRQPKTIKKDRDKGGSSVRKRLGSQEKK